MPDDPPLPDLTTVRPAPHDSQPENSSSLPTVQLTGWAIGAISAIVVIYSAITYGAKGYTVVKDTIAGHSDATAYTAAITDEMSRHEHDNTGIRTKLYGDNLGDTIAVYYASDGCIAISRPGAAPSAYLPASSNYEWSLGPSRRPRGKAPEPPKSLNVGEHRTEPTPAILADAAAHSPSAGARTVQLSSIGPDIPAEPVQAGCLNPHPGNFQGSWGPANGCWAAFYRRFNDGCTHYQMYNACQGYWDPQIHWTYCNPNHHL